MDDKIKYGVLSLGVILFQSVLKIYGVIITGSLSFLSETVDTLVDIIFVSILLYSLSQSQKPPDFEHMYGHSKIDPIGAMVQGIILINLYILLIANAIMVINTGTYTISNPEIGLQLLLISFAVNLVFSRFLIWQGRRRKSPSLEIQGLNLFQDSMRALIVLFSFILAHFGAVNLDPFFSIALSIWIIIGAFRMAKKGIKDLTDVNPINSLILEQIRLNIFNLDHVNGIEDLRIRASGIALFLEAHLSVEDHISVIHANEIIKSIRTMGKRYFPNYNVETIIEMNPLSGEKSLVDNVINLIYSMKTEYPEIFDVKNLNVFSIINKIYLSLTIIVNDTLSLVEAHNVCTNFENDLKEQAKLTRVISHIESSHEVDKLVSKSLICEPLDPLEMQRIEELVKNLLKDHPQVKGYHGFESFTTQDFCVLELHVFFDDSLNISKVHEYTSELEQQIRNLKIENLQEIIIHPEPFTGRQDGIFF